MEIIIAIRTVIELLKLIMQLANSPEGKELAKDIKEVRAEILDFLKSLREVTPAKR